MEDNIYLGVERVKLFMLRKWLQNNSWFFLNVTSLSYNLPEILFIRKPACGHPKVCVAVSSQHELMKGGALLPGAAVIIKAAVKQGTQDVKLPSDNV